MDRLRRRRPLDVWDRRGEGIEKRCIRTREMVGCGNGEGSHVHCRVEERSKKSIRISPKDERGGKGYQRIGGDSVTIEALWGS